MAWHKSFRVRAVLTTAFATAAVIVIALNFTTPEKRLTRLIEHGPSVSDPQFRREMGLMLGPSLVSGNRIVDLQNGEKIFPAIFADVERAKESITFETYIYWSGEVGQKFADLLSQRALAGVSVKVLVDWAGSAKMEASILEQMQNAGVSVHRYRPLRWYNLSRLNKRTHRKLLVVDGRIGFTGGVGIADQWQGHAQDPEHWRDMHFRVEGPVVAQLQAAFNDNWIKTTGEALNGTKYFPALPNLGACDAHVFISSPAGGGESMHLMYLMAIAAAERTIDLEAAYFVPDSLISLALIAARERGVKIRIIVPGPYIDSQAVRFASKREWGALLQAGIDIYEYQPTMLHNKLLIVDEELVSVGSTNFDIRSFRLNDEASLNIYDRNFASRMTTVFNTDLQSSVRYSYDTWYRRPISEKLIEQIFVPIKSQL